jgi:hypothetical protein
VVLTEFTRFFILQISRTSSECQNKVQNTGRGTWGEEVDKASLRKAITKISLRKAVIYLHVPNRSLQGRVTRMRKEREEKMKF